MTLTWAARAVDVTFVAPEGYRLGSVVVDGDYLEGFYDEASGQTTYEADLTPANIAFRPIWIVFMTKVW